ncbi:ROK family transcriptional regulator [Saccharomonospora cyanea]|uniref:Transcriptional regulator/sugar kinase n=1 Tax=Saccharomonospora cyanea NA-134 TaxID=882082 RepID=H5XJT9_9PSEU|nr:ROK family transcriptional regulator [Saccharomonospora cyanea]EHR61854.1 transcriptional regulator/sugar kinase [Saccharomonospora cyanea NA-134]
MTDSGPAGQHTVRRHNCALVLGAIASSPGVSRAGVAARTGLTKATVSTLVDRLVTASLVREEGRQHRSGPGRRGTSLSLSPDGPCGLGVEIGVDYLATCVVGLTGEVRDERVRRVDNRDRPPGRVLARVAQELGRALARAEGERITVGGVGVAVPGLVEAPSGRVIVAPNLGWQDVDLAAELRRRVPVLPGDLVVGNEANLAAVAELDALRHRDESVLDSFVHVSGEVGIGAGIVLGGVLFDGSHGFGGELGHFPVQARGPRCPCGARGCLERLAGQDAILERARADDVETLVSLLDAGERTATAAVRSAGRMLGSALSAVVNLLDVPTIVLGGTYARLHPWLADPLTAELTDRVMGSPWRPVEVRRSVLGAEAAVRGAAASALRTVLTDPDTYIARFTQAEERTTNSVGNRIEGGSGSSPAS